MQKFILSSILLLAGAHGAPAQVEALHKQFLSPPNAFSLHPYWFWNGRMEDAEIVRQIDDMIAHGVHGAIIFPFMGLETPYLSEEWFHAIGVALEAAKARGFALGIAGEYAWPSGVARDIWSDQLHLSRVLDRHPEYRAHSLVYDEWRFTGPVALDQALPGEAEVVIAGRLAGERAVEMGSLADITRFAAGGRLKWHVPDGRWAVFVFRIIDSRSDLGSVTDLLSREAMRRYIEVGLEPYYQRFAPYFGNTLKWLVTDHEGDYGYRIPWTPGLFDEFQKRHGYDLRPYLPVLFYDGGKITDKVRVDFMDLVSRLYAGNFFGQVTEWAEKRNLKHFASLFEESLQWQAAYEGHHFRTMQAASWPEVDAPFTTPSQPRDFKETASIAHFRQTPLPAESFTLLGEASYTSPQRMRAHINSTALWGANFFIPHAFMYDRRKITFRHDYFRHQPFWKHFKPFADYARRLSFMSQGALHVAPIAVYYPIESAFAHLEAKFASDLWDHRYATLLASWGNDANSVNDTYTDLQLLLTDNHWDWDVVDSEYWAGAAIDGRSFRVGPETFQVLILPEMTTVHRSALEKVKAYVERGGTVIALRRLPGASVEEGRDDPALAAILGQIFGEVDRSRPFTVKEFPGGGRAFFVPSQLEQVLQVLDRFGPAQDVKVLDGEPGRLGFVHRRKEGLDYYYAVNRYGPPQQARVSFAIQGRPVKWDVLTGESSALPYAHEGGRTVAELDFERDDAFFVVMDPSPGMAPPEERSGHALQPITLPDRWRFRVLDGTVELPVAQVSGQPVWLSPERQTIHDWYVIGPFHNDDHRGFFDAFPPEKGIDLNAVYAGKDGAPVRWKRYSSILRRPVFNIRNYEYDFERGPLSTEGRIVDLAAAASVDRAKLDWAILYAVTYVKSDRERRARLQIACPNFRAWVNGKLVLSRHAHPWYYLLREPWAFQEEVELKADWNEVLIKVERGDNLIGTDPLRFWARFVDKAGGRIPSLVVSPERKDPVPPAPRPAHRFEIELPPGARSIELPEVTDAFEVYLEGKLLATSKRSISLPALDYRERRTLEVRVMNGGEIIGYPMARIGETDYRLGSLVHSGLRNYSGHFEYSQDFELNADYAKAPLWLDLGEVGVAAEAWLNGAPLGARLWAPFRFDVTGKLKAGRNRLRIVVSNTMANRDDVAENYPLLANIDLDGLHGPVQLLEKRELQIKNQK